jgi:hypothetical protein
VALSAGAAVAAPACAPALVASTVRAAHAFAAGPAAAGEVPPRAAALSERVVKTMLLTRLRMTTAAVLLAAAALLGAAAHAYQAPAESPAPRPAEARPPAQKGEAAGFRSQLREGRWVLWSASPSKRTLRLFMDPLGPSSRGGGRSAEMLVLSGSSPVFFDHLEVAPDAEIRIDGKEAKLADLRGGMRLALSLADGKLAVTKIDAKRPRPDAVVKAVRAAENTLTVSLRGKDVDLAVGKDAIIGIDGAKSGLADLKAGMAVRLILAQQGDRIVVTHVTVDRDRGE